MTNLMHWRLLITVADAGSVSKAAQRYGITQSGASQAISQMEDMLGVKVFVRERRKTTVTAIGEQILERARRMLAEWESISELVDTSRGIHTGSIKLATFPSVFASIIPGFLRSFRELHPGVDVVLLEGTDEEIEEWLAANTIDAGIVMNPSADRGALILGRDAWIAAVPTSHPIARRATASRVALDELIDEPFVLATGGCHLHAQRLAEHAGLALSDVRMTVRDWSSAFALIREGVGVSVVPASTLPENQRGFRVFELERPIYREFGLVCSDAGRNTPAVRALFDQLRRAALHNKPTSSRDSGLDIQVDDNHRHAAVSTTS